MEEVRKSADELEQEMHELTRGLKASANGGNLTASVTTRIKLVVDLIRNAAEEADKAGSSATSELLNLADDIEKEAHHRLGKIILSGRTFWEQLERELIGK